jgi:hypothetical protein
MDIFLMDKKTLIDYFANSWKGEIEKYKYSGPALIDQIGTHKSVLDIGCGYHYFKNKFDDIYGIDIANSCADEVIDVLEFTSDKRYEAILCLGSINFGPEELVYKQCKHIVEQLLAKNGVIYWRCNPGLHDHKHKGMELIDFFPWSFDLHEKWSRQLGCDLLKCVWDTDDRIYAEWRKL